MQLRRLHGVLNRRGAAAATFPSPSRPFSFAIWGALGENAGRMHGVCGWGCALEVVVAGFDLKFYFERFPKSASRSSGGRIPFARWRRSLSRLCTGNRWLAAKDVLNIFDPAATPFGRYWPRPNEKELDQVLKKARLVLGPVPVDPRELVRRAIDVLHSTGIMSLVLRFAHPDRYGVFSTPIMNLLQVHRPRTIDLYLAYCEELRAWKEHFRMESVADTETALWTYHALVAGETHAGEASTSHAEFDADIWIQRRRVAQVLRPFLRNYGPLELARILVEEEPKLAGKIAGEEYERLLRVAARELCGGMNLNVRGAIEMLFNRLAEDDYISLEDKAQLDKAWRIRNAAVHAGRPPDPDALQQLP